MDNIFRESLWKNFVAAIDMFRNIIALCPEELWQKEKKFFYMAYHTSIFLDYYLTNPVKDFRPALPYTLGDPDYLPGGAIDDVIPRHFYSKEALMAYVSSIRDKCKRLVIETPAEKFSQRWINEDEIDMHGLCPAVVIDYSLADILLYNFRHLQHHVGQLNLLLRQYANVAAEWISQAD